MKSTIQLFTTTAIVFMMITGCNNNDTSKPGDEVVVADTPSTTTTTVSPTTSAPAVMDTSSKVKPNPAKKGMKGKVAVTGMAKPANAVMELDKEGIYSSAEVLPSYPGGENALGDYFSKNIEYPEEASAEGVEGTVTINFVVDENGRYSSPIIASPRLGYGLEEEALRVFNSMPKWNPGRIKGKNVKTRYTLPINFQLY